MKTALKLRHKIIVSIIIAFSCTSAIFSQINNVKPVRRPQPQLYNESDSLEIDSLEIDIPNLFTDTLDSDSIIVAKSDTLMTPTDPWQENYTRRAFSPDPTRAVWMSALFPGLGQVYNRRYWKVPIVIGGFLGLTYATSWNSGMLNDYTKAYRDITDNDPNTRSYMDFFPQGTDESSLDKTWLTNTFKSKKDYFRRNRDLCIISMVGVYLIAIVDAYVDASLAHFDISPDLSMNIAPTIINNSTAKPSVGLHWALCF